MSKYLKAYSSALDLLSEKKQMIIKNHISHYPILDELLGFQFYLNEVFRKFHNSQNSIELEKYISERSIHLLFQYNRRSLQSALNDIECDRIHQAAVNIRTVYESIPKMYYLALFPEETGLITVHEHITRMSFEEALKEIKGEVCIEYLNGKELTITTKEELDEFNKKYSHYGFLKTLYSEKQQKSIGKLYDRLSNSSHSNITRNRTATSYDSKTTESFFQLLKGLSYFNIHAYFEANQTLLFKIGIDQEIVDFLDEKARQFKLLINQVYLVPDNENLERKLKTKFKT